MIDIVIPTRERPDLTLQAVESVRAQTFTQWRLFVVDDASDDDSADRIEAALSDEPRASVVRRATRGGPQAARQTGLEASSAEWVALLDSDDVWLPSKLEEQWARARRGTSDVVLCWHRWERDGAQVKPVNRIDVDGPLPPLLTNNMSTPLFKAETLKRAGGFLPAGMRSLHASEGIELYVRLSRSSRAVVVPEVLTICREHTGAREGARLMDVASAEDLAAVLAMHRDALSAWPHDRAALTAQVGARFLTCGRRRVGLRHLIDGLRFASGGTRLRLARRYAPFAVRRLLVPQRRM